jgi:hypothetical protein
MVVDSLSSENFTSLVDIQHQCSQFICESNGLPLYKALPHNYPDVYRVKARFKRTPDYVASYFNKAFNQEISHLRQRAIIANSTPPSLPKGMDLFYVFPINNYKFLYSREVKNSNNDYKAVIDILYETLDDSNKTADMVIDLLKFTYLNKSLNEGINAGAEIIFYNIPFYYAVRVSTYAKYRQLIEHI